MTWSHTTTCLDGTKGTREKKFPYRSHFAFYVMQFFHRWSSTHKRKTFLFSTTCSSWCGDVYVSVSKMVISTDSLCAAALRSIYYWCGDVYPFENSTTMYWLSARSQFRYKLYEQWILNEMRKAMSPFAWSIDDPVSSSSILGLDLARFQYWLG